MRFAASMDRRAGEMSCECSAGDKPLLPLPSLKAGLQEVLRKQLDLRICEYAFVSPEIPAGRHT